jgi:thioesterase domain-containing protein/acyl carrier protein
VLDANLQPVPPWVSGELHIGGDGLARGYLNRPGLTAERFVPNPFEDGSGARLYKTGDLVRYLPNGLIEFLGRVDHQVKIRGYRIELGEIEAVLNRISGVREGVVIDREDIPGNKRLVGYVVLDGDEPPIRQDLLTHLREHLPDYMIPSALMILDEMPLSPNGKVDRKALPKPDLASYESNNEFISPRDHIERELVRIWQGLLDISPIGVKDNFFGLGGDSLLAARLVAQIEEKFGTNVPLMTLFDGPTIEQLAVVIQQAKGLTPWRTLVPIQVNGNKPPFFCVHPFCGDVIGFRTWSEHLGLDQPFYGLRARGLDGIQKPQKDFKEIASDYIEEAQVVQPHGPYYLGGYDVGGVIAFEMAQQLLRRGEKTALVAIINHEAPNTEYRKAKFGTQFVVGFLKNLPYWFYEEMKRKMSRVVFWLLLQLRPGGRIGSTLMKFKLPKTLLKMLNDIQERAKGVLNEHNLALLDRDNVPRLHDERQKRIAFSLMDAYRDYSVVPYPGKVTLFRTKKQPLICSFDPKMGWGEFADDVEVMHLTGAPGNIIREPHAKVVGEKLKISISNSQ